MRGHVLHSHMPPHARPNPDDDDDFADAYENPSRRVGDDSFGELPVMPRRRKAKRPARAADKPLTAKELAEFKGMILSKLTSYDPKTYAPKKVRGYTLADIKATPAQARLAIAFLEAMREEEPEYADQSVFVVPRKHIQGASGDEAEDMMPELIYEDLAELAEHIQMQRAWNRIEKSIGCYLEMNNSWSASIVQN